jgi:hypothetical protein
MLDRAVDMDAVPARYHWAYKFIFHTKMHCLEKKRKFTLTRTEMDDPETRAATGGDPQLDGLTGPLEEVFHPLKNRHATGGAATGGSSRGGHVDRDLCALIMEGHLAEGATAESRAFLVRVLDALWNAKLKPVAAQVPVFCLKTGIATTLDIVAIDMTADPRATNLVNIQLKTMGERNYTAVCGALASPYMKKSELLRVRDSYYMRHQLQVLVEHLIVNMNYDDLLAASFVLVATQDEHPVWYARDAVLGGLAGDVLRNLYARRREILETRREEEEEENGIVAGAKTGATSAGVAYAQAVGARRSMANNSARGRARKKRQRAGK